MSETVLEVQSLSKVFEQPRPFFDAVMRRPAQRLVAVDQVSFKVERFETLGLVGESGCGKTTLGRCILKLYEPSGGRILFEGEDITRYGPREMRPVRRRMQVIFQDPYSSLTPRLTVRQALSEVLRFHKITPRDQEEAYLYRLLDMVGLNREAADKYPREFSGGQRQRIGIARALAVRPEFIVADEPVSALDVSIQAQIINLLQDLQQQLGLTYLFIAHDLSVIRHISDRVAVMYLGRIVELASRERLYRDPSHPYTRALLSAVPVPDPARVRRRTVLGGDVPNPAAIPSGCPFHPRCPERQQQCTSVVPQLHDIGAGHLCGCLLRQSATWRPSGKPEQQESDAL
mgnify:CR=1 FL=1